MTLGISLCASNGYSISSWIPQYLSELYSGPYSHVNIMCAHEYILDMCRFPSIISSCNNVYGKCGMIYLGIKASE